MEAQGDATLAESALSSAVTKYHDLRLLDRRSRSVRVGQEEGEQALGAGCWCSEQHEVGDGFVFSTVCEVR